MQSRESLEIRDDGDTAHVERVLPRAFVPSFASLDLADTREGMFHGRAVPQLGATLGLVLAGAQHLEQRFLGVNGDTASAGGGAGRAERTRLADRGRKAQYVVMYPLPVLQAMIDEAHRLGKKTGCHVYGGEGLRNAIVAGCDTIEHAWP